MARKKRCILSGFCYHVMLRGNGGQDIYRDREDYVRFCLLLQYAIEKHKLHVLGFCLMGNHFHLIIQTQSDDLASGMHALAFRYAQYFNKKYNRRGYLYQGRYKAVLVQTGTYLRRLVRYLHLNPVRANIVCRPEGYMWSSYRAYIGSDAYTWLNTSIVFDAFGDSPRAPERMIEYTLMNDEESRVELIEIRKSLQSGAYGDHEFLEKWHPKLNWDKIQAQTDLEKANISLEDVIQVVCSQLDVTLDAIRSDKRPKTLLHARMILACLTQELGLGSLPTLGRLISRDPTSLAKLARKAQENGQVQALKKQLLTSLIPFKDKLECSACDEVFLLSNEVPNA